MTTIDNTYRQIVQTVLDHGQSKNNRTGVGTITVPAAYLSYDMSNGFPILSNKFISFKAVKAELTGFLQGITDKRWYQRNGCNFWSDWARPGGPDHDLGPIYGAQWRYFDCSEGMRRSKNQIKDLLECLRDNPSSRRMLVTAWHPCYLEDMALPPCHFAWQVSVIGDKLHLTWYQRSVDVFLGLPYNIAFYGLLLEALAFQFGYKPGTLTGHLTEVHIYENHMDAVEQYMSRLGKTKSKPELIIPSEYVGNFSILDKEKMLRWELRGYHPKSKIPAPVAV